MSKWIVEPREPQKFDYIDFPDADKTYNIKCPECGVEFSSENSTLGYKYCPYCGTEMEEQEIYCDRNLCTQNEYNGIGCDECIVNKE